MSAQDKETGAPSGAPVSEEIELLQNALREALELADDRRLMLVEHRRLVRELDVALNGEVGAAAQASLCDLVAQVRRQQGVQVLNLADGMRINFRAPDGRRATLHIGVLLDGLEQRPAAFERATGVQFEDGVIPAMRAAIAAYPVAGEPLPDLHSDAHDGAQVQALGEGSQVSASMGKPSNRWASQ